MKTATFLFLVLFLGLYSGLLAQNKPKPKEKPPTQKEMEDMMKEAEKMMGEMSAEDKKMMDSLGIKLPDINQMKKNASGISDKQLADAWEDENRLVPKRDVARIAAIPKAVTDAKMGAYLTTLQARVSEQLKPEIKSIGEKIYSYIKSNSKNSVEAGNMAAALWMAGKPELSLYVLGKICVNDPSNIDNVSNYASMLSMQDAQHLAIPILNNLNAKFPKNSTLLNNLGQAWFGLGEIDKAQKYLDSVIHIYAYHPQANLTKAAIEEHKGNPDKAREYVRNSMQHAYTTEKEEKLRKLGEKITGKEFRLPKRPKADPLNLGSFHSPAFPKSVDECIQAEKDWKIFYDQIGSKLSSLQKQKDDAAEIAMKAHTQRLNVDMALVKKAMEKPGTQGNFVSVPLYAGRAEKKYKAYTDLYKIKTEAFSRKVGAYMGGEGRSLKQAYDEEMEKLKQEDDEQTGEGKPNRDYCPKYKEASNKFLKAINPKLEEFYYESLKLHKEYLNESAYWQLYIQWPEMYEVYNLSYQMGWLGVLEKGDLSGLASGYPFVSITQYKCNTEEKEPKKTKLQNFDDVSCQYKDSMDLKIMKITNNCSRMVSEFDFMFLSYVRKDDFERAEGDTYTGSTIKISGEAGKDLKAGPLKVEAKIGAGVEFEFDREGVKDVNLIGEIKIGAGTHVLDEYKAPPGESKAFDRDGIGVGGKDAFPTTVEIGVEGRISIISGHRTVKGTGVLNGIKISER